MNIAAPTHIQHHPHYDLECEEALDGPAQLLIDAAVEAGWAIEDVFRALEEIARAKASAYFNNQSVGSDPSTPGFSSFPLD